MEEDLTAYLLAQLGVEVHWRRQPILQDSFPYINLSFIAAPTGYSLDGEDGAQQAVVQIDAWSETYISAVTLARQVNTALSGHRSTQGATVFHGSFKEGEFDRSAELMREDAQRHIHCRSGDYRLVYTS